VQYANLLLGDEQMKTKIEDKGKSAKKIATFLGFTAIMVLMSYLTSRGIRFDGAMSNWTSNHYASMVSGILAIFTFIRALHYIYNSVLEGTCPYCQHKSEMEKAAINLVCKACNKTSVRRGDYLESID
jgi:hypothetical protein